MIKPRFRDLRRFAKNIEAIGVNHRARFTTSLPFELGTINEFCWLWIGARFRFNNIEVNPAKFAYRWLVAELTANHTIKQNCSTAGCVNPFHAYPVLNEPPTKRATCNKKHLYNLETIYTYPNGRFECRICRRERWRRFRRSHARKT